MACVMGLHLVCKGKIFLSVRMADVMCVHYSMQEIDILEQLMASVILCTLKSTCRSLCNIGMYLITLLNILMPRY